jgi:hypothetical protein
LEGGATIVDGRTHDHGRSLVASLRRARDWDGLGAKAITKEICDHAITFLDAAEERGIPAPEFVCPSALGAIALEWRPGDRRAGVRVYSSAPDGCAYVFREATGRYRKGRADIPTAADLIREYLRDL